jgi:hypothetical protein
MNADDRFAARSEPGVRRTIDLISLHRQRRAIRDGHDGLAIGLHDHVHRSVRQARADRIDQLPVAGKRRIEIAGAEQMPVFKWLNDCSFMPRQFRSSRNDATGATGMGQDAHKSFSLKMMLRLGAHRTP